MADELYSIVDMAETYPYDLREDAFVFKNGAPHPFDGTELKGRTPLVAIGSNGSPKRLAMKFGDDAVVPVKPAQLMDHAIVYAAAITSYGSVPATLVEMSGATALVAVVYLDRAQIEVMHASESVGRNYEVIDLGTHVIVDEAPLPAPVLAYRSLYGPLRVNGQAVRLAEVPTVGTPLGAAYQSGILALLHHQFADRGEIYATFIGDLVASPERRGAIMASLATGIATTGRRCET